MPARTSLLATHQECFHDDEQVLQPELHQLRLHEHHLSPPYNSQQIKFIRIDISDNQPVWLQNEGGRFKNYIWNDPPVQGGALKNNIWTDSLSV